jgi:hypothetical protein
VALELPPPAPAATSTLPGLDIEAAPAAPAAPAARMPAPPFARPGGVRQPGIPNLQDPPSAPAQPDGMPQRGQSPNATLM